jgi:ABC-type branched-subunit amino acid transport system substrate-binding protein
MTNPKRLGILVLVVVFALSMLIACGGGDGTVAPTGTTTPGSMPPEDVVITIGNLTDLTGPTANGVAAVNAAVKDTARYFNDENLIPGVKLKVIEYDGQFDPSRDIPGYEWMKQKGADVIFATLPGMAIMLKSRANEDKMLFFATTGDLKALEPPGYVFTMGTVPQHEGYTMLKWLAEKDLDFPQDRPARVGGAAWDDGYSGQLFDAMKEYVDAHPDQFVWVDDFLTPVKFRWQTEVDSLKDCDYIFPPNPITSFADELRNVGSDAKLIGTDVHAAFLGLVDQGRYWDEIDGTILIRSSLWWNEEEGTMIDLTRDILYRYRAGSAEDIMIANGYLGVGSVYQVFDVIRRAAEAVGPDKLDSEALYEAAQSTSLVFDGVERYSFSETKRDAVNYFVMYEIDGAREDMFRVDPEWVPVVRGP